MLGKIFVMVLLCHSNEYGSFYILSWFSFHRFDSFTIVLVMKGVACRPSSSAKYRKSLRALRDHTTRSRVYPYQSSPPSALQRVAEEAAEAAELEADGTNAGELHTLSLLSS